MPDPVPLSEDMGSAKIQAPEAQPEPADFKPRDNPAFILHGKLKTSFGEVSSTRHEAVASVADLDSFLYLLSAQMKYLWR
jgi:hypothetical protein